MKYPKPQSDLADLGRAYAWLWRQVCHWAIWNFTYVVVLFTTALLAFSKTFRDSNAKEILKVLWFLSGPRRALHGEDLPCAKEEETKPRFEELELVSRN